MNDQIGVIIISALVGGFVSAIVNFAQNRMNVSAKIDEAVRADRAKYYQLLWQLMGVFPLWPRPNKVTYEELNVFSEAMRDWYFSGGGMYLSKEAREAYEEMQGKTIAVILKSIPEAEWHKALPDGENQHYQQIQKKLSALRTHMTNDLLSRRSAPDV
jgi:hypothetical protein